VSGDLLFRAPTPIRKRSPQSRTLADLLHELMASHGLTQRGLAAELRVSPNTVSRLLHNQSVATEETLDKIAAFAHLPIVDVRELADRSVGEAEHFTLPKEFDQLTWRQRAALLETGRAMLDGNARRVTR
jgi:transcriptional regulator with XRE-family HTH domain